MSDLGASTPRVFLIRHGETEWTIDGRFTGVSDIELTDLGRKQVTATGSKLVGAGKLIDPSRIARIWISPRRRAQETFNLVFDKQVGDHTFTDKVIITEQIREWDYGDYEGMKISEIRELRKANGMDIEHEYSVWRDGCEGGESTRQISDRLDRLITQVQDLQAPHMNDGRAADVVLVAHGLILRCFFMRWLKLSIGEPLPMLFSPGAIAMLSYKNHDVQQPGFHIGLALPFEG